MIFNTRDDIASMISGQFARIDLSCYSEDFDTLVEYATDIYIYLLKIHYNFNWGDEEPENDIDFFELIDVYSI